MAAMLFFLYST